MSSDAWTERDLVILREIVEHFEAGGGQLRAGELAERTGFEEGVVRRAVAYLWQDDLIIVPHGAPRIGPLAGEFIHGITPNALRKVESWPSADPALSRIIAALEAIALDDENPAKMDAAVAAAAFKSAGSAFAPVIAALNEKE